VLHFRGKKN